MPTFRDKLQPTLQRKLLALDGGGIRGVITLEVLERVEAILHQKLGRPDAVLADEFDYMAGASTGAIIVSCLALGMPVDAVRNFYIASGPDMFSEAGFVRRFHNQYDREQLANQLQDVFAGTTLLGSDRLRTLPMLVKRNATTDSPWPVCNNPAARFPEGDCRALQPKMASRPRAHAVGFDRDRHESGTRGQIRDGAT